MLGFARLLLALVGIGSAIGGLALLLGGQPEGLSLLASGAVLGVALVAEWRLGRREAARGAGAGPGAGGSKLGADFTRTDELFLDPETGRRTRVWVDPATGERSYRPEP